MFFFLYLEGNKIDCVEIRDVNDLIGRIFKFNILEGEI